MAEQAVQTPNTPSEWLYRLGQRLHELEVEKLDLSQQAEEWEARALAAEALHDELVKALGGLLAIVKLLEREARAEPMPIVKEIETLLSRARLPHAQSVFAGVGSRDRSLALPPPATDARSDAEEKP